MKIEWNTVTRFSQVLAIVLFVGVFFLGIFLGRQVGIHEILGEKINDVVFVCDAGKSIHTVFYPRAVHVAFSSGQELFLPQTISASGARYANSDESFVFWNKGDEALIMKDNQMDVSFKNCKVQSR